MPDAGIRPKGTWLGAAVVADEGRHGLRGIIEGVEKITPETMRYVIISGNHIVAWESFDDAGNPATRLEVQVIQGVDSEKFLQDFAKLYGGKYVGLPYRSSRVYQCFHLAPVPEKLLKPPALMGIGGAYATYESSSFSRERRGVLLGP